MASEPASDPTTRPAAERAWAWLRRRRAVAFTLLLLAAAGWEIRGRDALAEPASGGPGIALAFDALPLAFDEWIGRDIPSPPSAVELLNPSALLSREYRNHRTGETVSLLVVRCADARDLAGHYPPNCYPAHGKEELSRRSRDWTVDGPSGPVRVPGYRYRFAGASRMPVADLVVDNFMVLPGGEFGRSNEDLVRVSSNPATRRRGASQVQVVSGGAMTDERRDEVFRTFVARVLAVLEGRGAGGGGDE